MSNNKIKRTERGWAGHFIGALKCKFRRNTLLEYENIKIVISTVGLYQPMGENTEYEPLWDNKYYFETKAFPAKNGRYNDAIISKEIPIYSKHYVEEIDADDIANNMHEMIVDEISNRIIKNLL